VIQSAICTVETKTNELVIDNIFGSKGSYARGGAALSFIFSTGGTNPGKACDAGNFIVKTYATVSGTNYLIDYYEFDSSVDPKSKFSQFIPTPATLLA
jgi:hypothetical protein